MKSIQLPPRFGNYIRDSKSMVELCSQEILEIESTNFLKLFPLTKIKNTSLLFTIQMKNQNQEEQGFKTLILLLFE
jgi:hypothetical protein